MCVLRHVLLISSQLFSIVDPLPPNVESDSHHIDERNDACAAEPQKERYTPGRRGAGARSLTKKISALNAKKKAAAAQEKLDDAKGLPKWNLFRVLPKQTTKGAPAGSTDPSASPSRGASSGARRA